MTSATRFSACAGTARAIRTAARPSFSKLRFFMESPAPRTKAFCHSRPSYFAGSTRYRTGHAPLLDHGLGEIEGEFRIMNHQKRLELPGDAHDISRPGFDETSVICAKTLRF